jgi:hypothetical protein
MTRMLTHAHKETIRLISTVFCTIMMQEFWNEKDFILVNFFPRETTLNLTNILKHQGE